MPFGVIGGRLYHVITDHDLYFGEGRSAINALYVWRGGLGIWVVSHGQDGTRSGGDTWFVYPVDPRTGVARSGQR